MDYKKKFLAAFSVALMLGCQTGNVSAYEGNRYVGNSDSFGSALFDEADEDLLVGSSDRGTNRKVVRRVKVRKSTVKNRAAQDTQTTQEGQDASQAASAAPGARTSARTSRTTGTTSTAAATTRAAQRTTGRTSKSASQYTDSADSAVSTNREVLEDGLQSGNSANRRVLQRGTNSNRQVALKKTSGDDSVTRAAKKLPVGRKVRRPVLKTAAARRVMRAVLAAEQEGTPQVTAPDPVTMVGSADRQALQKVQRAKSQAVQQPVRRTVKPLKAVRQTQQKALAAEPEGSPSGLSGQSVQSVQPAAAPRTRVRVAATSAKVIRKSGNSLAAAVPVPVQEPPQDDFFDENEPPRRDRGMDRGEFSPDAESPHMDNDNFRSGDGGGIGGAPLTVQYESYAPHETVSQPVRGTEAAVRDLSGDDGYSFGAVGDSLVSGFGGGQTMREESEFQTLDYINGISNTIYTKTGYTTVVIMPAGEKLTRVTLGDRRRFNVSTVYDKSSSAWHIYLQPLQMDIETNMVIATDRHLYNATLATSDFFKPFVKWVNVPGSVESVKVEDGGLDLAVKNVGQLNFKYKRSGKAGYPWTPQSVFDDKNSHTFISFDANALEKYHPVILIRDSVGNVKMIPYSRFKNTFVLDNVYDNLEVRVDDASVTYTRRG